MAPGVFRCDATGPAAGRSLWLLVGICVGAVLGVVVGAVAIMWTLPARPHSSTSLAASRPVEQPMPPPPPACPPLVCPLAIPNPHASELADLFKPGGKDLGLWDCRHAPPALMATTKRIEGMFRNELVPFMRSRTGEGFEGMLDFGDRWIQAAYSLYLAGRPGVKTICEIGFNAGFSGLVWLEGSTASRAKLVSHDICTHTYTLPAAEWVRNKYGAERFELVCGDSKNTVPKWPETHGSLRCDIIFIDGGHTAELACADIANSEIMAYNDTVVVMDDFGCGADYCGNVERCWRAAVERGTLEEIQVCSTQSPYGFPVGRYPKAPARPRA